ncbi:uncharacterized protein PHACADRAFT_261800 [Phanerochaete carnosa HHB-10118-sp]|uniref:Uncharacterized protein n=1 Tax=Phanerochaete carnosa (strain HHB-10118-sp) TaxID=650164 RepID=K5WMN7_PHACS|nr:uncharacterized protein PHACADRAFT_261800 [Phanerochaete carnosa HHB-10118-sp]EKM51577.1 hypothetical protein PHACADRAFT_261800 [Phanerochaete carnosa HHB-10118-sp]
MGGAVTRGAVYLFLLESEVASFHIQRQQPCTTPEAESTVLIDSATERRICTGSGRILIDWTGDAQPQHIRQRVSRVFRRYLLFLDLHNLVRIGHVNM